MIRQKIQKESGCFEKIGVFFKAWSMPVT